MRANLYIDGFNLYMSRLRQNRQFRWLDIAALGRSFLEQGEVLGRVNFYTAYVSGKIDPDAVIKQQTYLAALKTLPEVGEAGIHAGNFLISKKWVKLCAPAEAKPPGYAWNLPAPEFVLASIAQEKGSDVKLGVHLLRDAYEDRFDVAYVITNDTDLVEPIRIVAQERGKQVVVVAPSQPKPTSRPVPAPSLKAVASRVRLISDAELIASQFPQSVRRANGRHLQRPATWQ